eukprot:RCo035985
MLPAERDLAAFLRGAISEPLVTDPYFTPLPAAQPSRSSARRRKARQALVASTVLAEWASQGKSLDPEGMPPLLLHLVYHRRSRSRGRACLLSRNSLSSLCSNRHSTPPCLVPCLSRESFLLLPTEELPPPLPPP